MSSIYLLFFENDSLPLYVGYTSRPIEDRHYEHNQWVRVEFGKDCEIIELETIKDPDFEKAWCYAEKKWIKFFKQFCLLDNRNSGGYCFPKQACINGGKSSGKARIGIKLGHHSEERKRKISQSNKGKKRSEETRAKLAVKNKGRKWTEEQRAKIIRSLTGRKGGMLGKKQSQESKSLISKAHLGKRLTDEHKTNIKISWMIRRIAKELNISYQEAKIVFSERGK